MLKTHTFAEIRKRKVPKVECPRHESSLQDFGHDGEDDAVIIRAAECRVRMSYNRPSRLPWAALEVRSTKRPAGRVINPTVKRSVVVDGADAEAKCGRREHHETSLTHNLFDRDLKCVCAPRFGSKGNSIMLTRSISEQYVFEVALIRLAKRFNL